MLIVHKFDIIIIDTFENIRCFPFQLSNDKRKVGDIYDKKRNTSIYYNHPTIYSNNFIVIKIVKASDFNYC